MSGEPILANQTGIAGLGLGSVATPSTISCGYCAQSQRSDGPVGIRGMCVSPATAAPKSQAFSLLFAELRRDKQHVHGGDLGPERFNNLDNDPDKNLEKAGFVIEHEKPGRTDCVFDRKTRTSSQFNNPVPVR
jgi:hypothetical protein